MAGSTPGKSDAWVQPALLCAVASALVLYRIGTFGLWSDEAFSVSTSLRTWGELAHLTVHGETNGALYAFLLKVWAVAGVSETWLRLPSAASFVLTVALTWALGRRLHGHVVGACAAILVTVHGSLLQYGQNIRYYAPVAALSVGFALAVHRVIERPSLSRRLVVTILGIALPLCHLVAATMLAGAAVLFLVASTDRSWLRRWLLLVPGALVGLGVAFLVSSRDEGQSINQQFGAAAIKEVVLVLTGSGGPFGALGYGLLVGTAALMLPSALRRCRSTSRPVVEVMSPWIFVSATITAVTVGSFLTTLMVGRYVLFLAPFLALIASMGLVTAVTSVDTSADHASRRLGGMVLPAASPAPWGALRLLSVGGLAVSVLVGSIGAAAGAVRWTAASNREDWRPVARTLLERAGREDAVLFANDSTRLFVEYELRRHPERLQSAPTPFYPAEEWGRFRTGDHEYEPFTLGQVDAAIASHRDVWLVVERPLVDAPMSNLVDLFTSRRGAETVFASKAATLYRLKSD